MKEKATTERKRKERETAASINKVIYKFKLNKYSIRFLTLT